MEIKVLVENNSKGSLVGTHGLSLYIKTKKHNILFDLGPDDTLVKNAKKLGIDLAQIDIVIISHGHNDHAGFLPQFLDINKNADIYVQRSAFLKHYSIYNELVDISIDSTYMNHRQIKLLDDDYIIDCELSIIKTKSMDNLITNSNLYCDDILDDFDHEHYLLIKEDKNVVFTGCTHKGIISTLNEIGDIDVCIGGFHLANKVLTVDNSYLDEIINKLNDLNNVMFYTCHCTGLKSFEYIKKSVKNLEYIMCSDNIIIEEQ